MATRVTPYLGGTGQDNTRKLNVHSSLNRVSIGADVLASANLDVFGNTFVRGNVETANTFVSTSNSNTPLQAFVGETAGGRWLNKGGSSAFAWYSDTLVTPVTGFSSLTYYGTTFYPKIVFGSLGDVSVSGKFATNLAQINRDGTASFGGLTVPALNTVSVTGNVYISGNLFVAGNSYQIISNITQAVGNVVTANAYVVTRLLGVSDIPMSNGITFSNANLVISAYANPSIVFSANNNVWVGSNTAIIGRVASVWTYNPYQLVDDGLVVQHNGGRGNIIQTWIDGRVGTTTRPWSLALTTQGDMAWLVGTAANVKPTIQRMMIDQNGNTLFGTGTVNRANVTITGNASVGANLIVGTTLHVTNNVYINNSVAYDRANLGAQLTILQPGNITAGVPFVMTSATSTLRATGASWGFGINQLSQEGRFSIMMGANLAMQPNVEIMGMSRATSNVDIKSNLFVTGTSGANIVTAGNIYMGQTTVFTRDNLATRLVLIPSAANPTEVIQSISTGTATTSRSTWGFGINQGGELGRFSIMKGPNAVAVADREIMYFGHTMPNVVVTTNVWSNGSISASENLWSPKLNYANVVNEAAVQAAITSRGWPAPIFGFIATPEVNPPGNFAYSRAAETCRINEFGVMEVIPANTYRHEYDLSGNYRGIFHRSTATSQIVRWSNNLSITNQITLANVTGTFQEGELITCTDNSNGIYIYGTATIAGVSKGNGGIFGGFITGSNSLATANVTLNSNVWTLEANIIATANQYGVDGIYGSGTLLEATGNNAIIRQTIGGSTSGRAQVMYVKRVQGDGPIYMTWKTSTTWQALLNERNQEIFTIPTDRFIQARSNGVSTNTLAPAILMTNANDKIVVGYIGMESATNLLYPSTGQIANVATTTTGAEVMSAEIPGLLRGANAFTFYVKAQTAPQGSAYLVTFSDTTAANAISLQLNAAKLGTYLRNNAAVTTLSLTPDGRWVNDPQDFAVVCRIDPKNNNSIMVGNDRLYANNSTNGAVMSPSAISRIWFGRDGAGVASSGISDLVLKEIMVWPYALDDESMRLIGNGSKDYIPRPFIENAGHMRPIIQALTKLKLGGTGNVSIECAGDSYGTGATAGTSSWPYYLAKQLDTTYSNSQAAVGWAPTWPNLGPAHTDKMSITYPTGSWTHTQRTSVAPSLSTSSTTSANGYISYNVLTSLGSGIGARLVYVGTSDGQVEYSWNAGVTRYALDLTAAGVGNVGYYDLGNVADSTLRVYRLAGTINIAGVNFTNSSNGVVIHKMCNASGLARDWYQVDSTQWKLGYEMINPTASIIMLGTYDQVAAYNEQSFAFFLQNMIDRRRATVINRPIMIVMPPDNRRSNITPMDYYSREARRIAAVNNCTFVDLQWMFGNKVSEYDTSWWSDTIVPNLTDGGPALVAGILRALESAGT